MEDVKLKNKNFKVNNKGNLNTKRNNEKEINYIQLKKSNILKFGIRDEDGNDTGEHLEFDLEDTSLLLKLNECKIKHDQNLQYIRNQFIIIDKKEDVKGNNILSWKEEEKLKALNEFYKREMQALDLFLGKNATRKLLNGRSPYYNMYEDFGEIIDPILPQIQAKAKSLKEDIIKKYGNVNKNSQDKNVLK